MPNDPVPATTTAPTAQDSVPSPARLDATATEVAGDGPSRCNLAFKHWSSIGRQPAATALIGILDGEGIGPELMAVCRLILERVGACAGQRFLFETGAAIGTPAFNSSGQWVTAEVEGFIKAIHARGGAVLCGPGGGRFVYELRRRLNLFCKLVPLRPSGALRDLGPLRPRGTARCRHPRGA
jgi:hypothetical protein